MVYHCAAYTAVDAAEEAPGKTINQKVNVDGTAKIAAAANEVGAIMVYISTDYVFAGDQAAEYTVDAQPAPRNEYGRAKYEGERAVQCLADKYTLFAPHGSTANMARTSFTRC